MAGIRWSLIFLLVFITLIRFVFLMTRETSIFYLKSVVKNIQYCTLIFGSLRNSWVKKIIQETTVFILLYNKQRALYKSRTYSSAK